MRISDWSSDVCSSDLAADPIWVSANAARDTARYTRGLLYVGAIGILVGFATIGAAVWAGQHAERAAIEAGKSANAAIASHEAFVSAEDASLDISFRSEEHTSELQSLMRLPYSVFC